eukprot:TRINITY_DN9276_c0_g1_i1.p1 TRINITY_DN9276_c0_g1~~TRINITY_DN9276_c0_g1_i1.p1  ORF type:complete len:335 (+),score=142.19 TRINITY_DN9276_c0_g1_i1:123-1127(+)
MNFGFVSSSSFLTKRYPSHLLSRKNIQKFDSSSRKFSKMSTSDAPVLVSTNWLSQNLNKVKVLDGSWNLNDKRDFKALFENKRIPGASFFDIDEVCDKSALPLPHNLPPLELFQEKIRSLNISNQDHVVVYDQTGFYNASGRVWWTFKVFGHERVSVLEGGILKWIKEGRELETTPKTDSNASKSDFVAKYQPKYVDTLEQVFQHLKDKTVLIDARPPGRFRGEEGEPRPNLKKGHIPGSKNAPGLTFLKKENEGDEFYHFLSPEELKEFFKKMGVDPSEGTRISTTCGSGVTASSLCLALHLAGNRNYSVYDGAYTEWAQVSSDRPVESGPSN